MWTTINLVSFRRPRRSLHRALLKRNFLAHHVGEGAGRFVCFLFLSSAMCSPDTTCSCVFSSHTKKHARVSPFLSMCVNRFSFSKFHFLVYYLCCVHHSSNFICEHFWQYIFLSSTAILCFMPSQKIYALCIYTASMHVCRCESGCVVFYFWLFFIVFLVFFRIQCFLHSWFFKILWYLLFVIFYFVFFFSFFI